MVYYCAKKLQNYNFIIIGPEQKDLSKLKILRNVYVFGAMPYSKVPAFLYNCQVGIIPFDVKNYPDLVNSINPLKAYEYLVAKIPVVAIAWEELEQLGDLVFLSRSKDDFIFNIKKFNDLDVGRISKVENFIKDNDWNAKIQKILNLLFSI